MANEMKATSDGSGKKSNWRWIIAELAAISVYGGEKTTRTHKEIGQEASGQKAVPADASAEEKQVVALVAQVISLHKENDTLNESFQKTFIGIHLLQPETLSSPEIAGRSLNELESYCASVESFTKRTLQLINQARQIDNNSKELSWADNQYEAGNERCSALVALYQYASDPDRNIHVTNGEVLIVGAEGYNKLIDKANDASKKLKAAMTVFEESQKKLRQEDNITASDYGLKN